MKRKAFILGFAAFMTGFVLYAQPVRLYEKNPHYFFYRGKPMVLITSGEHYGAVINADFDFEKYLSTLHRKGLNHTRIFLGDYVEAPGDFCIENNTLAPEEGKFLCPFARSNEPGYILGGNKFDLSRWDEHYFQRLHQFMKLAQKYDIVVEAVLFFASWKIDHSPLYFRNNVNGTDSIAANKYMTLENGNILKWQKRYEEKLVKELNRYDNLILNIANEPWFANQMHGGFASPPPISTFQWIHEVSEWIVETEKQSGKSHLISVDYTNEGEYIPDTLAAKYLSNISVLNVHYDRDAMSLRLNAGHISKAFAFNETGLMPVYSDEYRIQGWKYMMSGGALYNNLDYTYQVGAEDGSGNAEFSCSWYNGCGDHDMKYQMAALLRFMEGIPFWEMLYNKEIVDVYFGNYEVFPFVKEGALYVVYITGEGPQIPIKVSLLKGEYEVKWLSPKDLSVLSSEKIAIQKDRGSVQFFSPAFQKDIVLKIKRLL